MSFNRRRACFVCGRLGHLADACSAPSRLCFQCGEPGHESSACESPRTDDHKQCYGCGGVGHIKSACPSGPKPRAPGVGAGGPHLAKQCPQTNGGVIRPFPGRGAPGAGGPGVRCHNCGGPNHFARDCKSAPMAGRGPVATRPPKKCYNCQGEGHLARFCPTGQGAATASATEGSAPAVAETAA
ncbi:hypothetical protein BCV69DRAFT_252875 [Microstroma glucosiphilum]|uniref:CCHC-type domain-containing protein n=1 Tax=Pseudomicrostroma glucosiphilum TaxID=1684307 RepID=A0A316TZ68_9BASI|nr:hypothetical protein BCV69DRAFT_252875 [Pseudomicrostroma glucosiphilum]PWN18482.1 hypothetical protein BCV69DRAFT_252875 [Pseudomicrostroma glucosiphilum]